MSTLAARPPSVPSAPEAERERSVVAWNASRSARSALAWAAAREHRRGGSLSLVRVLDEVVGTFRLRSDVQRGLAELDAELVALRKAFPGLAVTAELRGGAAEEVLPSVATGPALLVVGAHAIRGSAMRSPWSLGLRLLAGGQTSIAIVPTECWSWRSGVVVPYRGAVDGAAVLFAAEEAQARAMRLTLVAPEGPGPDAVAEAELIRAAFPGLGLDVIRVTAVAPVLIGLARSAALLVTGSEDLSDGEPPLCAALASASEAPVAVIRAVGLRPPGATPARSLRSLF